MIQNHSRFTSVSALMGLGKYRQQISVHAVQNCKVQSAGTDRITDGILIRADSKMRHQHGFKFRQWLHTCTRALSMWFSPNSPKPNSPKPDSPKPDSLNPIRRNPNPKP